MPASRSYRPARKAAGSSERVDAYQQVTDRIVEALEAGTVPWRKPWKAGGWPSSMSTGKPYRGVNVMLLGFTDYPSKWWGTYRQIQELGGQVQAGQHSTLVTFWKELQKEGENAETGELETQRIPMLKTFRVFNWCQADWQEGSKGQKYAPVPGAAIEPDANAEALAAEYLGQAGAPKLRHDVHGKAYYQPATDTIHIPPASEHTSADRYYSTLFHEMSHGEGHVSRLNRWPDGTDLSMHSEDRGKEELIAEMGAAFLNAECGTGTDRSEHESANYLASWLEAIKADKRLIVQAAAAGQRAADRIAEPYRQATAQAEPEAAVSEREAA